MKTTLFIITASLFSGIAFAQQATVKTTQATTINNSTVNGSGSASIQTDAAAKTAAKVKTEGTKVSTNASSAGNTAITAGKTGVSNTTGATVKTAHSTTGAIKSNVKSADAGVKTKANVMTSPSIKAGSTVKTSVKTPPVKVASNLKVGIK